MAGQKVPLANDSCSAYVHSTFGESELARRTQADELTDLEGIVGMRLSTATRAYIEARRGELHNITRKELRYILTRAQREIGPDLLVRNLRRRHVEIWMGSLDHLAPSSRRRYLSVFKVFCRWLVLSEYLKADPTLGLKGPRVNEGMPRELDKSDIQKLLAVVPDNRGRVMVYLGVHELLRRAEIAGVQREEIDFDRAVLFVRGKGGTQEWLPLSPETLEAIEAYMRECPGRSGPLIRSTTRPGYGVDPKRVGALISEWMRQAGVKRAPYDGRSAHALRHSGIGAILDSGADTRDARDAARLKDLSTLDIYARKRRAQSRLREVMGQQHYGEGSPGAA